MTQQFETIEAILEKYKARLGELTLLVGRAQAIIEMLPTEIHNLEMQEVLKRDIYSFYELSARTTGALKAANINTLADLVSYSRAELVKLRNFGRKSLNEVDVLLESKGLRFGTDVTKYGLQPIHTNP